jgi:hypothetical protein
MQEICNYQIEIQGGLDQELFNAESPIWIELISSSQEMSRFSVQADQPGVIGLIRHLHRQGFLLLSLHRECSLPYRSSEKEQADGSE